MAIWTVSMAGRNRDSDSKWSRSTAACNGCRARKQKVRNGITVPMKPIIDRHNSIVRRGEVSVKLDWWTDGQSPQCWFGCCADLDVFDAVCSINHVSGLNSRKGKWSHTTPKSRQCWTIRLFDPGWLVRLAGVQQKDTQKHWRLGFSKLKMFYTDYYRLCLPKMLLWH